MKNKYFWKIGICFVMLFVISIWVFKNFNLNFSHKVGEPVDNLNGVVVYYNGGVNNVLDRNLTDDGYNLGMKYQCVEFVKRYYYEHLDHKMPESYGHAKDFFNEKLSDGKFNEERGLVQYGNPSNSKPKINDLIIFNGNIFNFYGHVAIISDVGDDYIEIIQQNPGLFGKSRRIIYLKNNGNIWTIEDKKVLGRLRKE